jgi:hypothetical protein
MYSRAWFIKLWITTPQGDFSGITNVVASKQCIGKLVRFNLGARAVAAAGETFRDFYLVTAETLLVACCRCREAVKLHKYASLYFSLSGRSCKFVFQRYWVFGLYSSSKY